MKEKEKQQLESAMLIIEDYLNAGFKEARKQAHEKAKLLYEEYHGKPYKNRDEKRKVLRGSIKTVNNDGSK